MHAEHRLKRLDRVNLDTSVTTTGVAIVLLSPTCTRHEVDGYPPFAPIALFALFALFFDGTRARIGCKWNSFVKVRNARFPIAG